ncbi:hypothetical protein G4V72_07620 [Acinetobacter sp. GC2]|uniref:hypothetical protein n=1 Tax=Acinetobacter lwoffii TaxID=28090 RepID=UPI0013E0CC3C|nr:hypothetical protein [Acinetobacter lwoffii]NGP41588.1 hypothetical protein [Acinetobacter lwoffii]
MNTKLTPHNSFKVTLFTAAFTVSALAFAHLADFGTDQVAPVQNIQSEYGIVSLKMHDQSRGEAILNLDGFRLNISSFEVQAYPDSYGVPGSEFTAVEVMELGEINVFDANGNPYNDFTDHQDHREINSMIAGYIMKHRLVEVRS